LDGFLMGQQILNVPRSRRLVVSTLSNAAVASVSSCKLPNVRNALLIYAILFFALIHPFWLFGELVVPYRLASEIGAPAAPTSYIENRKFSDYWRVSIPGLRDHLQKPRFGGVALWTDHNELGRPPLHIMGLSPAYAPIRLISKITANPLRVLTLLSLGTCFFAGLFVVLLCKELSLEPIAGLLAGASIAASPLMMYWLTFPMFLSAVCWTAGCLYALTRLARCVDPPGCAVLAFCWYSLFMTGYPQAVVFNAYILAACMAWLAYGRWQSRGLASTVRYLAAVAAACGVGTVLVLPVYLDIAEITAQSARVSPDVSFFLEALYKIDSVTAALRFFALGTFPEIAGNPISPSYPLSYDGGSVTALVLFFAFYSLLQCWRKTWGWWLAVALLFAFALIHPLYAFGVRHLGFNLSRSTPTGTIILPLTMILAYGVNAFVRRSPLEAGAARLAISGTLACFAVALCFYWSAGLEIRWNVVVATLFIVGLLYPWGNSFQTASLIAALIVTGVYVSFPLMLRQPQPDLIPASALVDKIRAGTPPGSRFAIVAPGSGVLLPNMNGIFDLASIHSYDSLSPRRYQALIGMLGGQIETYGRLNETISPDYQSQAFWMSNIGLMISTRILGDPNLEHIGDEGPVHLYRVVSRMGCCLQAGLPDQIESGGIDLPDQRGIETRRPVKTKDEGDLKEIAVYSRQPSLLVLSQQYDSNWHATIQTPSGWAPALTSPVNGVFQGVVLPGNTQTVRLQYLPFVRFAWIGGAFWALVLLFLAVQVAHFRLRLSTRLS
jgi:hypothetical protein